MNKPTQDLGAVPPDSLFPKEVEMNTWTWHRRLISLSDMEQYLVRRLISVSDAINNAFSHSLELETKMPIEKQTELREEIIFCLKIIARESQAISLPQTAILANRMILNVIEINEENSLTKINELEDRFRDEIKDVKFFQVTSKRLSFYENTELADEQFKEKFPRANAELIEAGNCFALDRYTACVVHLMRSLEVVLTVLHRSLGIPEPEKGAEKTWGKILHRILAKITGNDSNPPAGWVDEKEFYHRCYAHFSAVKMPYRDSTMHVESTYDEQSASDIFDVTKVCLRFMAEKLHE